MNRRQIKSALINLFGDKFTAYIQALYFVHLIKSEKYFEPEIILLDNFLKFGDIAIDIGANGANWTYALSKLVGKEGQVFAFEADPYYAKATELAIKLLHMKGVTMFPFGLSENDEEVVLRTSDSNGNRLSGKSYINKKLSPDEPGTEKVNLKKLDSLLNDVPELLNTALIKCDVEGYELFVFKGAMKILENARPYVILEVGNYEIQGYSERDVFDFFQNQDYSAYCMTPESKLSPTDSKLNNNRAISYNRIMIPFEKMDRIMHLIEYSK
jgi:FkbM family methyltransferase